MSKSGPETRLVSRMVKAARAEYGGALVIMNNHGGLYSANGVSDLTGCLNGTFWACEVKAPESYPVKGEASAEKALLKGPTLKQRLFVKKVLDAGGCAGFAATVEQFMEVLAHADWLASGEGSGYSCEGHNIKEPE